MYVEPVFDGKQTAVTTYRVMEVDFNAPYEVFRGSHSDCYSFMITPKIWHIKNTSTVLCPIIPFLKHT